MSAVGATVAFRLCQALDQWLVARGAAGATAQRYILSLVYVCSEFTLDVVDPTARSCSACGLDDTVQF